MSTENKSDSVIIIGAGFAGLGAGIFAQMNGYKTEIFELHDKPGGLCTAWKRKGFTIDGCIHWLVGSSPKSGMHDMWEEVGVAQGLQIIDMDEYCRFEHTDGRKVILYTNVDKLEKHLLELSPADAQPIKDFTRAIRLMTPIDPPSKKLPGFQRLITGLKVMWTFLTKGALLKRWLNTSAEAFSSRFKDPLLRQAFKEMWFPEFSMFFMLFTFAYMHNKNAGYPLGGSMPMSEALETKYKELGGVIHYKRRVEKILTKDGEAIGVKLPNGEEHFAGKVISAADGYATIFQMLDGKFGDEKTFKPFKEWKIFPPLVYIGLGVNRTFENEPLSVSGISFKLKNPVNIAGQEREWLPVHIFNHDPSMAPAGKTTIAIMLPSIYDFWKSLDQDAYLAKKQEVASQIVKLLEQRFPGISGQVEMTDVSTPLTFEHYTGNWQGSFEGWMITPENSGVLMKKMPQELPGLKNFYMCGQWVEPGGGLPTGIMSGKRLVKAMCKADRKKFTIIQ